MAGRLISTLLGIMMMMFITCLIIFFFLHQSIRENVSMLNYEVSEIAATAGILSKSAHKSLKHDLEKYGAFSIALKLEVQLKPGVYDTFYEDSEIIDRRLKTGDKLTILIQGSEPTVFERLLNAPFLGTQLLTSGGFGISSLRTAVITKNALEK